MRKRARSLARRPSQANIIAGFLLIGWGGKEALESGTLITNSDFRKILVGTSDSLRTQVLWQLRQWAFGNEDQLCERVLPFLHDVWPRHRALKTPLLSSHLVELALNSGDLFPDVVVAILPRLVPIRGGHLRIALDVGDERHLARRFPSSMLELLWAILADDVSQWPYKATDILGLLETAPETVADPRLSELRRRRAQY
ncbi:hypothetical protein [Magnetospirillum gryphiswaldense]|nr:hypothetical protein [Magnetospirillum gryphiswaldense]AVM72773.1 hypothetical protein MSR1_02590 [Magnetospirillum gryphiswaldense MSR-1]AVM76676.1 hypothetical protein MSR1L_02590 [Magnetospirillum gryphiswaldense]